MTTSALPARSRHSQFLLLGWVVPAAVCGAGLAALELVSSFVGAVFGLAGGAYLSTSLITLGGLALVNRLRRSSMTEVGLLVSAWTMAWVLGIVTFSGIPILLDAFSDASGSSSGEGLYLSPIFWLLSFPLFLVFLVSALVLSGRRTRHGDPGPDTRG